MDHLLIVPHMLLDVWALSVWACEITACMQALLLPGPFHSSFTSRMTEEQGCLFHQRFLKICEEEVGKSSPKSTVILRCPFCQKVTTWQAQSPDSNAQLENTPCAFNTQTLLICNLLKFSVSTGTAATAACLVILILLSSTSQ